MKFKYYQQLDSMDCGPTCIKMIGKHYGYSFSIQKIRDLTQIGKNGVNLLGLAQAAEGLGFRTLPVKVTFEKLKVDAPLPCIVHWGQNHFVVVYKISERYILLADPARGLIKLTHKEFESIWTTKNQNSKNQGIALLLEPTQDFYQNKSLFEQERKDSFSRLYIFVIKYKSLIYQLFAGLIVGSIIQLIFPFLTQMVVDTGIRKNNIQFIYLILAAQLALFLSKSLVEFLRSWILLHISTRINLSILSDFLSKLLKLPLTYFESKSTSDILQRIGDHKRIESFLTNKSLGVVFGLFNIIIFTIVLLFYSAKITLLFWSFFVINLFWVFAFLKARRSLDNKRFILNVKNQGSLIQLIQSIAELKLNDATLRKRWEWENLQIQDFQLSTKELKLEQYQQLGASFINESKNILIIFLSATSVVEGDMTFGAMLALQYIISQLNSPVDQLAGFAQHYQDAKLSLNRFNEIYELNNEEDENRGYINNIVNVNDIIFKDVYFTYPGAGNDPVLKNINLKIPVGKVTAIVGSSGSGKTTLLKLILKFLTPQNGKILTGNTLLENIRANHWRKLCGTVFQDGYIFSDTIANNICISEENINYENLGKAIRIANFQEVVDELPMGYNTKIGVDATGLSQGQKQRILIARAVYKNPDILLFDEATNSLDAENEKLIMENLEEFFRGKTVVTVAHRLSTVKNAHQIIVMEKGTIVEVGNHSELTKKKGRYYELVKNQLELEN